MDNRHYKRRSIRNAKARRRRRRRKLLLTVAAVSLILLCTITVFKRLYPLLSEGKSSPLSALSVNLDKLYSPCAILIDPGTGKIIAGHNSEEKMYPASLTKLMTALLAVEQTDDLDDIITLSSDFFQGLHEADASLAGFEPGEDVRLKDLLYGVLLPSGAECCLAFSHIIAGSEEEFVKLMNKKAKELGMNHTHFCNSTGLHNDDHYSTVGDIAVLLKYALKNNIFREAFTSSRYSTLPSLCHPDGFTFYSTLSENMSGAEVIGGEILGGKTGYTQEAGLCLASLARVNGKEYILVTAGADGDHDTEQFHISDAVNVYNQLGASS